MKKILVLVLVLFMAFTLVGKSESAATTLQDLYAQAELLLVQGDYNGAAAKFDALGAYSDASQMAMYCKATAAVESFGLYDMAIQAFEELGNFKDSKQLAVYYKARDYEAKGAKRVNATNVATASDEQLSLASFDYGFASATYSELAMFKDCMMRYSSCIAMIEVITNEQTLRTTSAVERKYQEAITLQQNENYEQAIALFTELGSYKDCANRIPQCYYNLAEKNLATGKWEEAVLAFTCAGSYSDAPLRIKESYYKQGESLMVKNKWSDAVTAFKAAGNYRDALSKAYSIKYQYVPAVLAASNSATFACKPDGTVIAAASKNSVLLNSTKWKDIHSIYAGSNHVVSLKSNGTVVAIGNNDAGQCNVAGWKDIVAVSIHGYMDGHTVGLKSDGTVVAVGKNSSKQCNVSGWKDIVAVSAGWYHTIGLKSDGTVVAVGDNDYGQCNVSGWEDIVAISAGGYHTVGVKSDGTVVAVGNNQFGQLNMTSWNNIVAVSCGEVHTVGLKSDGTVVAVGDNGKGQLNTTKWKDIVAIDCSNYHTVGLKFDGTVIAVGKNNAGECNVSGWNLLNNNAPINSVKSIAKPTTKPNATPTPKPYKTLKEGSTGSDVTKMKKRLQELGYYVAGSSMSDKYNSTAAERVKLFQKVNGLKQTGIADNKTLTLLYSNQAKKNPNPM